MALVVGIPKTTADIAYSLAGNSEFVNFAGDTIISTSNFAIGARGNNNTFTIGGHVYGNSGGLLLFDFSLNGLSFNDTKIDILKGGVVGFTAAATNDGAIVLNGSHSTINNAGTIVGNSGILIRFSGGSDTSTINNTGLILTDLIAVRSSGAENLTLTNSGTIRSLSSASYSGTIAIDKVTNKGLMIGDVTLGLGNDTYDGRLGRVVANAAGAEVEGGIGNDRLLGGKYVDTFLGGADNDTMTGAAGKDILTGGTGLDQFVFNSAADRGDTITDFSTADDLLVFKASSFGGLPLGMLSAAAFRSNTTGLAGASSDRFIYDTDDDQLWYDSNGNAAGGRYLMADLNDVALTRADILLI